MGINFNWWVWNPNKNVFVKRGGAKTIEKAQQRAQEFADAGYIVVVTPKHINPNQRDCP